MPADERRRRGAPVLAAGLRLGGRARGERHRAGGARGRVADGAVRHHATAGCSSPSSCWSPWCWRRPASRGCGCSSASACRGRRPGGRRGVTAHAFAASARGRRAAGRGAAARARPVGGRGRARPGAAPLGAGRGRASPPSSSRCPRCWSGCPRRGRAVAQPVDALLPLQGAAGPRGSVQVSIDPGPAGRQHAAPLPLRRRRAGSTQPTGITVSLTEASQQIGPLDVKLQPAGPGHYIADGMDIPGAGTWTLTVTRPARRVHRHHRQHRLPGAVTAHEKEFRVPAPALGRSSCRRSPACSTVLASAACASAHVAVSSPDASAGGYGKVTFRVPDESDTASTVKIRIQLPTDTRRWPRCRRSRCPAGRSRRPRTPLNPPVTDRRRRTRSPRRSRSWSSTPPAAAASRRGSSRSSRCPVGPFPDVDVADVPGGPDLQRR